MLGGALGLLLALSLVLIPAPASAVPQMGHVFYGNVTSEGKLAAPGTSVVARVGELEYSTTVDADGGYGLLVEADDPDSPEIEGASPDDPVEFYVGDKKASLYDVEAGESLESYPFEIGGATELDLTVGPPTIALSSTTFTFSAIVGGANPANQTLEIWNSGAGTLDWSVSDNATWLSLLPTSGNSTGEHDSVTLSVNITDMSAGDYSAAITISATGASNTPQTATVTLNITTALEPDISVDPTSKDFGDVLVDSVSTARITVSNVGTANLVVGTISITGTNLDQFTILDDNCSGATIAPEASATLKVVFSPTSIGAKSAALSIPSNDPDEDPFSVTLSGTGVTEVTYYTLTVDINPSDSGNVTLAPIQPVEGYAANTTVALTATANAGYSFGSWSGNLTGSANPTTIVMDSDKTVTANFEEIPVTYYTLTVDVYPSGSGNVTLSPSQPIAGYEAGTSVTLTAYDATGDYEFDHWSGDLSGDTNPTSITMNDNYSITANFKWVVPCFIATAAYGTPTAEEIDILREFRDEVMLPDKMGAAFVSFYYHVSPPMADFISRHEVLRTIVRKAIVDPLVMIVRCSQSLWD